MATLKLLHLLFLFTWIGSLLMVSRFLGYLPQEEPFVQKRILRILKRIYFFIDLPSMIVALVLGIVLFVVKKVGFTAGWLHMKLTFAAILVGCDLWLCRKLVKERVNRGRFLHGLAASSLVLLLFSVYVLKNKMTKEDSLAKKDEKSMISPLKVEEKI